MKNIALIILIMFAVACKTKAPVMVPVRTTTTVEARPVTVSFKPDSLALSALFRCDSNYQVVMSDYSELYTDYMNLHSTFQQQPDGGILVKVKATAQHPDTTFILNDTTIYQEVPIIVNVEVPVEKPLTWLQRSLIYSGIALWVLVTFFIVSIFYNPFKK